MRGRRIVVALGLLTVGVASTTAWYARYDYDPTSGPIDGSENGLSYAQPIDVGRAISIGITTLYNGGTKPAVVEKVRLLGVTGPLELVGVATRHLTEEAPTFAADFEFPPERYAVKPLAEQNVLPVPKVFNEASGNPMDGLQLAIGIRATSPGIAAYRAVDVRYRIGGRQYREVFEANAVHLCAPLADYSDPVTYSTRQPCPPRELKDRFEDRVLEWPPPASKDAARQ